MCGERSELARKILMTADAAGGVWHYAVDLCAALSHAGVQVLVATLGTAPTGEQVRNIEGIRGVRLVHANYALEWMENPWRDVDQSGVWLQELQADFGADLIHLNGFSHAALGWKQPVLCVAHSCVWSWWRAVEESEPGGEWSEYKRRVEAGLEASNLIAAPSESMARCLVAEYGTESSKIRVIHNSTRAPEYSGRQKEAFILAAGRAWDRAKNFGLLTEIAPALDWPLRIAGAGEGPAVHEVSMLGVLPKNQLEEQMRRASIFVHPALYEPFGLAVLEAARARCCLVLSDIPSLRELWDGAAVFLDPRDPELWAFEVNELCRDFSRRQRMADRAVKRSRRYNHEAMLAGYLDAYASLLSAQNRVVAA